MPHKSPELDLDGNEAAVSPEARAIVEAVRAGKGEPLRRPRGRPRAPVKRDKLTVLFSVPVALRLRLHCDYTGSELSAFVERAVVAALDGASKGPHR